MNLEKDKPQEKTWMLKTKLLLKLSKVLLLNSMLSNN